MILPPTSYSLVVDVMVVNSAWSLGDTALTNRLPVPAGIKVSRLWDAPDATLTVIPSTTLVTPSPIVVTPSPIAGTDSTLIDDERTTGATLIDKTSDVFSVSPHRSSTLQP